MTGGIFLFLYTAGFLFFTRFSMLNNRNVSTVGTKRHSEASVDLRFENMGCCKVVRLSGEP